MRLCTYAKNGMHACKPLSTKFNITGLTVSVLPALVLLLARKLRRVSSKK